MMTKTVFRPAGPPNQNLANFHFFPGGEVDLDMNPFKASLELRIRLGFCLSFAV